MDFINELKELERSYLNICPPPSEISVLLGHLVAAGSYVEALQSEACQEALCLSGTDQSKPLRDQLEEALTKYLVAEHKEVHIVEEHHNIEGQESVENEQNMKEQQQNVREQHVVLCCGIAAISLFTQNNFTGPLVGPKLSEVIPNLIPEGTTEEDVAKQAVTSIAEDTEGVYGLLKVPEYLLIGKVIFVHLREKLGSCISLDWWSLRFNMLLQRIANENSTVIYERVLQCINSVENNDELISTAKYRDSTASFYYESGQAFLYYSEVGRSQENNKKAKGILGTKFSLTGALGKRTKFQVDARPQLVVKVEYDDKPILEGEAEGPKLMPIDLPQDILLNDDTRLQKIAFLEVDEGQVPNLSPVEQIGILSEIQHKRRSQASDLQLKEETKAYLSALIQFPKCWVIQYVTLMLRSLIECDESRAVQRAVMQLEELVLCVRREEPSRYERLKLFYASGLPTSWETQQEYGRMLVTLGSIKTALQHFEELQLWEDVIDCYNRIQMRQRSETIIREMMTKEDTPKLWCLLGDATDDIECYNKAWELSNHKSSRAQRSLGEYYFYRKDYKLAIEHYEKSIEVNHLQIKVLEKLGYAALMIEEWTLCAKAYRKCSILDPEAFEYWNNMAKAYMCLDEKYKAWKSLEEALRCRSDSWRVHENFMTVSASLGYMNHALNAYKRLLELKPLHLNLLIISCIVHAIIEKKVDEALCNPSRLYKSCLSFIAMMCQTFTPHADLWCYYGELVSCNPEPSIETRDLACQHFRKSLAIATRDFSWHKEVGQCTDVLAKTVRLVKSLDASVEGVSPDTALTNVRSVAMLVGNTLKMARKGLVNVATGEIVESAVEQLKEAEDAELNIKQLIATLSSSNDS